MNPRNKVSLRILKEKFSKKKSPIVAVQEYDEFEYHNMTSEKSYLEAVECECKNCADLLQRLSECGICLNPLQGPDCTACPRCGGLWCGDCARKMPRCPYCRAPPPARPCPAVSRIMRNLSLPCRNQRLGCTEKVIEETRMHHESTCTFNQVLCPIAVCNIGVPVGELADHIMKRHKMPAYGTHMAVINLTDFNRKMQESCATSHSYSICLVHRDNIFKVVILLFNYNIFLKVKKHRLRHEIEEAPLDGFDPTQTYYGYVEFQCPPFGHRNSIVLREDVEIKETLLDRKDCIGKSFNTDGKVFISVTHNRSSE